MSGVRKKLRRFAELILQVLTYLCAALLASSVIFYAVNCFMRYVVHAPMTWPEEYCIYIVVLMVYLITCRMEFFGEELSIGIIDPLLEKSKFLSNVIFVLHGLLTMFIMYQLYKIGVDVVAMQNRYSIVSPVMRIPMSIYFGLVNASFVLVIVFWVINLLTRDYKQIEEVEE